MPLLKPPLEDRAYPHYKFRDLLAAIGSDKEIQALIQSYGYESPTLAVIRGWRSRNSIPSRWLPLIVHRAMQGGDLKDVTALLETPFS